MENTKKSSAKKSRTTLTHRQGPDQASGPASFCIRSKIMSSSDYYERVSAFQNRLSTLLRSLSEAQKIISPSPKDRETFPGLIDATPKDKQLELLQNAWIVLEPIDTVGGFGSDIEDLMALFQEVGNCPVEPEPAFQGHAVGK